MGKKRCRDDEDLLPKGDLIQILLRLPVTSLLRFKSVCKSWLALIESSFFIDLHTTTTFNSSSKFGSFILQAGVKKYSSFSRENRLLMLSSVSESESGGLWCSTTASNAPSSQWDRLSRAAKDDLRSSVSGSGSSGLWWSTTTGSNAPSGQWDRWSVSESGSGGLWWSTTTGSNGLSDQWDRCLSDQWDRLLSRPAEDDLPDYDDDDQVFKVEVEEVFKVEEDNLGGGSKLVLKLDNFGFPSCYKVSWGTKIVGSCNGLVCLYEEVCNEVSIWNPATGQFRILPKPITIDGNCPRYYHLVAFGFDVETKDYKVVQFSGFKTVWYRPIAPIECPCRVQVYSLSSDSWRLLEGITYLPGYPFFNCSHHQVLYLNGSCFFLAHFLHSRQQKCVPENDRFIISFDFTKEIITPMKLPDHHKSQELYLSYFGDKIALFTVCYKPISPYNHANYYHTLRVDADYNIWVHDGTSSVKKESWKKLHSFRIKGKRPGKWNVPKGISNDGEFALLETEGGPPELSETGLEIEGGPELSETGLGKKMKLYNLVTKEVKKDFLFCNGVVSKGAHVYKPSLVSIIGGNGASASASASADR